MERVSRITRNSDDHNENIKVYQVTVLIIQNRRGVQMEEVPGQNEYGRVDKLMDG